MFSFKLCILSREKKESLYNFLKLIQWNRHALYVVYFTTVFSIFACVSKNIEEYTVVPRSAICKCRAGYTGDPYTNCQFDPCSSSPCGPGALCENNGRAAICKCPPQHIGDPYVSCRLRFTKNKYQILSILTKTYYSVKVECFCRSWMLKDKIEKIISYELNNFIVNISKSLQALK
jgi:hypothetical protein